MKCPNCGGTMVETSAVDVVRDDVHYGKQCKDCKYWEE